MGLDYRARSQGAKTNKDRANKFAMSVLIHIRKIEASGIISAYGIAQELNRTHVETCPEVGKKGKGKWYASSVLRYKQYAKRQESYEEKVRNAVKGRQRLMGVDKFY